MEVGPENRGLVLANEGRRAGQALEEHAGEGVQICSPVDSGALDLLRREVVDRPEHLAAARHAVLRVDPLRQSEVGKKGGRRIAGFGSRLDDHVGRLDISVDKPGSVCSVERARDLATDRDNGSGRKRCLTSQDGLQVLAFDVPMAM